MKNNYYDIAFNEYLYLQHGLGLGFYNSTLPAIQQICEKLLKSIIIDFDLITKDTESIMKTHRLDRLYMSIMDNLIIPEQLRLDVRDLTWLTNFYFDCRYPGDTFLNATQEHQDIAVVILEKVFNLVNTLRKQSNSSQTNLFQ